MPTPTRPLRVEGDLWDAFDKAVKAVDVEADRSGVLRNFMRWYVGQPGATIPERPTPQCELATEQKGQP